ncbi:MAG: Coenzyme F420 hydrogenase/dehydrogenase, beta subunit C-terminal domain [Thermoplasmata archaeon]|nr:Coenzyme F420 hydrogenase/dehydrogenase, beta subunit C-terminal domain [Thermoplasmata archaeon]
MLDNKVIMVEKGDMKASVNEFLRDLLRSGKLRALLVMQDTPSRSSSFPVLVFDPERLNANVFAPVLPVSTATLVSNITRLKGPDKKVGVVMRPCQIRALVELTKLNQANLDNVVIIGVDCPGTFPPDTFSMLSEKGDPVEMILDTLTNKEAGGKDLVRTACRLCKEPVPSSADLMIGIFGLDPKKEILIQAVTEEGKKLIKDKDLQAFEDGEKREKAVEKLLKEREEAREAFMKDKAGIKGIEALAAFYDRCTNCHNCMRVCPICYCRECLFDSSLFDLEAERYLRRAEARGLYKMPTDSLLFHVTRMHHMIVSCVGCGLCEQACPSDIPLMDVIIPVAERAQDEFDYIPGRSINEKLPLVVYKEDEYEKLGEE